MKLFKFVVFLLLMAAPLFAQTPQVPRLINFQSVLTDPAGNPLLSGLYTVYFRILGPEGEELYQESQSLETEAGAVSTMVGAQGNLLPEIFDPNRPHFLGVQIEGQGPEKQMEIATVPYSFYAERALGVAPQSITAEAIQPHAITADLLAEDVLGELLAGLRQTGSNLIGVQSGFIYSAGSTVQAVLKDLDTAIHQRRLLTERQIRTLDDRMTAETLRLDSAVTTNILRLEGAIQQERENREQSVREVRGEISGMNLNISSNLSGNSERLREVEEDLQALNATPRLVSAGIVDGGDCLSWGYNVSQVTDCRVAFRDPIATPYVVQITGADVASGSIVYSVRNISSEGFTATDPNFNCNSGTGSFHFVVFK